MKIYQYYSTYGFSNTYTIVNESTKQAIIVDPSELSLSMIEKLEQNEYELCSILVTHNHQHHVKGLSTILKIYNPTVYASNAKLLNIQCRKVRDGDVFLEATMEILAISVPGHSQDSMVYRIENAFLFTGDVLHAGLIGKTNSAFNTNALLNRIRQKLFCLSDDTIILPGHGPPSTIGTEKSANISYDEGFAEHIRPTYDFFI